MEHPRQPADGFRHLPGDDHVPEGRERAGGPVGQRSRKRRGVCLPEPGEVPQREGDPDHPLRSRLARVVHGQHTLADEVVATGPERRNILDRVRQEP